VHMLYPTEDDWTERYFWDLVSHQLGSMERPYLSLAIRTDRLDSFSRRAGLSRVRGIDTTPARQATPVRRPAGSEGADSAPAS